MKAIPINIQDCGRVKVEVRVTGIRRWKIRCWLMTACFHLGAWLAPKNVRVDVETDR